MKTMIQLSMKNLRIVLEVFSFYNNFSHAIGPPYYAAAMCMHSSAHWWQALAHSWQC